MLTRRQLLERSLLLSLSPLVPSFLYHTAWAAGRQRDRRRLVVIQLDGGNDGLNTVVPFRDDNYARLRPKLKLSTERLIKLNDEVGLHPAMKPLSGMIDNGRFSVVQGVGYPNPNRSHFESMAIWHSARLGDAEQGQYGWLGRTLDAAAQAETSPHAVFSGAGTVPVALWGRRATCASIKSMEEMSLDVPAEVFAGAVGMPLSSTELEHTVSYACKEAFATSQRLTALGDHDAKGNYSESKLAQQLKIVASLIKSGTAARVFYTTQGGYDTHATQLNTHYQLLNELSRALQVFLDDLANDGLGDEVLVLAFSEFGRRAAENASEGTDHGAAAPIFLAGPKLSDGVIGRTPDLAHLESGDVPMSIDFRRVYATLLDRWLDVRPQLVLAGAWEPIGLFT